MGRATNQDNYYISGGITLHSKDQERMSASFFSSIVREEAYGNCSGRVFAVSDGMGGHSYGEVASRIITSAMIDFECGLLRAKTTGKSQEKSECVQRFQRAVFEANEAVLNFGEKNGAPGDIGATFTGIILFPDEAIPFNIGDSSTFLFENGSLQKLTKDNNEAQMLVDMKLCAPDDAERLRGGRRLTRYVGLPRERGFLSAAISEPIALSAGQCFLMCSDGLTDCIERERIQEVLAVHGGNIRYAADKLLDMALTAEHGGSRDNITLIIIEVVGKRREGRIWKAAQA